MDRQVALVQHHWNYFLALEDDIARMTRYLEPAAANYSAYSLELARIFMAAAAEIDVIAKLFCKQIDPDNKAENITGYRQKIIPHCDKLPNAIVLVPKFGLTFTPWEQWQHNKNPSWWRAYTEVKHQRDQHFASANLENTLNAVAGLYLLLIFFFSSEAKNGQLAPDPLLLKAGAPFELDYPAWGPRVTLYTVPDQQIG